MSDVLKCQLCGAPINGMTGLQELQNLRKHMAKKHANPIDMNQALELRVQFEDAVPHP